MGGLFWISSFVIKLIGFLVSWSKWVEISKVDDWFCWVLKIFFLFLNGIMVNKLC